MMSVLCSVAIQIYTLTCGYIVYSLPPLLFSLQVILASMYNIQCHYGYCLQSTAGGCSIVLDFYCEYLLNGYCVYL